MTFCDSWYSFATALDGMRMPSPPSLAGSVKRVRSRSPGGDFPVMAGMTAKLRISSSGFSKGHIHGMVRLRYIHLLIIPCVSAEKAA